MNQIPYVEGAADRPNVLFVFSDQHNARCLGAENHPDVRTPHLDRLAGEGVRFTNAYVQNTICTPSRMCYLSGTYPSTHGYYGLYGREPDRLTSAFAWFRAHGYRTGALGKLHTPRYWIERDCQYVYDEFIQHPTYLEALGLFDLNDNRNYHPNAKRGGTSNLPLEHSCEWVQVKHFRRFLDQHLEPADRCNRPAPWMAWMTFARPHQPYTPSEPYASMYDPSALHLPPVGEGESPALRAVRNVQKYGPFDEQTLRHHVAAYLGCVSQVDAAIGMMLDDLANRGQIDNTIIVYAADHGDHAGEHGMYEKKAGISARSICRTPMIVRFPPAVRANWTCQEVVESVDVLPTLCDLAGIAAPSSVQGRSMTPLLGDDPRPIRDDALTENLHRKALATKQFRYVANLEGQADELYDVQADPWEQRNLIDDPHHAETARRLGRRLRQRLVEARRPVTAFRGGWHGHRYDTDGRLDPDSLGPASPYD